MKIVIAMKPNGTYTATIPDEEGDFTLFSSIWATDACRRDPYETLRDLVFSVLGSRLPPLRELLFDEMGRSEIQIPLGAAVVGVREGTE